MDHSFRQQVSATQQPGGILARLHVFESILHWLAGLIQLTEEEQKDAGICYPDDQRDT